MREPWFENGCPNVLHPVMFNILRVLAAFLGLGIGISIFFLLLHYGVVK